MKSTTQLQNWNNKLDKVLKNKFKRTMQCRKCKRMYSGEIEINFIKNFKECSNCDHMEADRYDNYEKND